MHLWSVTDIVALSCIGKLTNAQRIALMHQFPDVKGAMESLGVLDLDLMDRADQMVNTAAYHNVAILTYGTKDYPLRLTSLEQPPLLVYVLGELPPPSYPYVSVVGTRQCTVQYGKSVTDALVKRWTEHGCAIVSGLAKGIDTLAHEACLRSGGRTVAVIASGIGRIAPAVSQRLAERIVGNGGAVICEYPFHTAAIPPHFPARNRIIAALSDAVVIVESKLKGGALITAAFALQQGIPVWSVPGPITATRSAGTNMLIATGNARILTSADALLSTLPHMINPSPLPHCVCETDPSLQSLSADPFDADQAARLWQCSIPEAMMRLFDLELNSAIRQLPGGRYLVC